MSSSDPLSSPLSLNLDMIVRGALAASAIGFAAIIVLLEVLYVSIAVCLDDFFYKKLGFMQQSYLVVGIIVFSIIVDVVLLPLIYYAAKLTYVPSGKWLACFRCYGPADHIYYLLGLGRNRSVFSHPEQSARDFSAYLSLG